MQPTQFLKVELHQNLFFTPKIVGLKIPQICVPDDLTIRIFPFVRGFDGIMGFLFLGVALIGYPRFLTSNHSSLPIGSTYGIFIYFIYSYYQHQPYMDPMCCWSTWSFWSQFFNSWPGQSVGPVLPLALLAHCITQKPGVRQELSNRHLSKLISCLAFDPSF